MAMAEARAEWEKDSRADMVRAETARAEAREAWAKATRAETAGVEAVRVVEAWSSWCPTRGTVPHVPQYRTERRARPAAATGAHRSVNRGTAAD